MNKGIYYTCPKAEENNGMFVCKTLRLLNYLVRNGFDCIKVRPDRENTKFTVFIFDDSKQLRNCLDKYNNELR